MKKINQYLVSHYPLVWNTRLVWVLLANAILHLLFFLSGYGGMELADLKKHYYLWGVGGGSLMSTSVLSSLLVLIVWLVFYLRNNAFKSHYPIGRWHGAKEFLLIFLMLFTTITYFASYRFGVRLKVRSLTPVARFVEEVNRFNLGKAFIPTGREEYFILNNCENRSRTNVYYNDVNFTDTNNVVRSDTNQQKVKAALRLPDAFSYRHYCTQLLQGFEYEGILQPEELQAQVQQLTSGNDPAAVSSVIADAEALCRRYGIDFQLDREDLARDVFATPTRTPRIRVATSEWTQERNTGRPVRNSQYILTGEIEGLYRFLYECLPNEDSARDRKMLLQICGYVALALSVWLLCYRRFSRKVFLVSIVGTLVWAIFIGLLMASGGGENMFPITCLLLCSGFLLVAFFLLRDRSARTLTGVLLNWHVYLVPYLGFFLYELAESLYEKRLSDGASIYEKVNEQFVQQRYPVLYWINHHSMLLFTIYLLIATVYIALLFNRWARRWQVLPHE